MIHGSRFDLLSKSFMVVDFDVFVDVSQLVSIVYKISLVWAFNPNKIHNNFTTNFNFSIKRYYLIWGKKVRKIDMSQGQWCVRILVHADVAWVLEQTWHDVIFVALVVPNFCHVSLKKDWHFTNTIQYADVQSDCVYLMNSYITFIF